MHSTLTPLAALEQFFFELENGPNDFPILPRQKNCIFKREPAKANKAVTENSNTTETGLQTEGNI